MLLTRSGAIHTATGAERCGLCACGVQYVDHKFSSVSRLGRSKVWQSSEMGRMLHRLLTLGLCACEGRTSGPQDEFWLEQVKQSSEMVLTSRRSLTFSSVLFLTIKVPIVVAAGGHVAHILRNPVSLHRT
jgi:hypothetical protein